MITLDPDMLSLVLSFLMSFALVYSIMPGAINIAVTKKLVAMPEERSSHEKITPCIGGIPIAVGVYFTVLLLTPPGKWETLQYLLGAMLVVVLVGAKDDIQALTPWKKLVGQLVAITIIAVRADVRLESMYGLLGFDAAFPAWLAVGISMFTLLVITNSFNLIDGINGLTATVGTIALATYGVWFFVVDMPHLSLLAMAAAGAVIAFLRFNVTPAQTFMGDAGALFIGLIVGVMTIEFIASGATAPAGYRFNNPIAVAVAILIIPLFDTIRVFITRLLRGKSPLQADRRHIHHLLIDSGFSHMQATAVLGIVSLIFLSLVFALDPLLGQHQLIALELVTSLSLTYWLHRTARRRQASLRRANEELATRSAPVTSLTV